MWTEFHYLIARIRRYIYSVSSAATAALTTTFIPAFRLTVSTITDWYRCGRTNIRLTARHRRLGYGWMSFLLADACEIAITAAATTTAGGYRVASRCSAHRTRCTGYCCGHHLTVCVVFLFAKANVDQCFCIHFALTRPGRSRAVWRLWWTGNAAYTFRLDVTKLEGVFIVVGWNGLVVFKFVSWIGR